jgi:signal transduction histidine kinase/CheY-like chemotaxis protein
MPYMRHGRGAEQYDIAVRPGQVTAVGSTERSRIIVEPVPHELEYRLRQQALLAELGRRALSEMALDALLEEAARLTALGMSTEFCKVMEYLPAENRLLVRAGAGWEPGVVGVATLGADLESPAGYALHTGKPVVCNNLTTEERFRTPELLRSHGMQRAVNVILVGEGKPFGILEADSRHDGTFNEHDIDFLQGVANLVGMAIERLRAHDALREINAGLEQRVAAEVAERRQTELALTQAQKMEAVGQLTGGVAHDFNNLLMVISASLDLAAQAAGNDERLLRLIAAAQKATGRGEQLTSQLLAFSRHQALRPEIHPINELVREFDVLASRILGDLVEVDFDLAPDAWVCEVDPAQFGSALLNLVLNARDAMPSGGKVAIRTRNVELDAREAAAMADARPGACVVVTVEDTGIGMAPEVLRRAVEPFFTTKEVGRGTGLGLSQVYGFVRQSGGFVHLQSAPRSGTTVRIFLPRAERAGVEPVSPGAEAPGAGSETILVVEDDEDVRGLLVEMLSALGYRTLAARNGPEALAILDQQRGIALLLADILMPGGMTGIDLAPEARQRLPRLRVLLTSVHAAAEQEVRIDSGEAFPVLGKPYKQAELGREVRSVLDRRD